MRRLSIMALGATAALGLYPAMSHAQAWNTQTTVPASSGTGFWEQAPVGKQAGTFLARLRVIGVIPETFSSSITPIGGQVNASGGVSPELDLTYFFTDNIALEGIAASTHHRISAGDTALGHVDVGSAWVLPPTLTLQYHFMPHQRFSPYVGVGLTVAFFYATDPATPTVQKFSLNTTAGPTLDIGFDYNISGHWFANLDAKQMFINTTADINGGAIKAHTALNPTVIGAGIGYRF